MAAIVENQAPGGVSAVAGNPYKLSWGAIFGGAFVALALWLLLNSLGLALGLSTVDPNDPGSARAAGIGTGIWSAIAPLIALFCGGFVAARSAGRLDKGGGALHGAVLWGLTTLVGISLLGMLLSSIIGTALRASGAVMGATGAAVAGAASGGGQAAQTFGLDANDALGPINRRLQAEGKPTITANQLQTATSEVLSTALRTGNLDREVLVTSIADNTRLSRQDAEGIADRVNQQFTAFKGRVGQVGEQVQQGALQAAQPTSRVFWGIFASLLLGLVSAMLGATVGVSRRQRIAAEGAIATPPPRPTEPTGPRREVYP
ncbi:hypothetical protein [Corallococcus macrosporus]|uniref:PhnA-like protein n=1 Tax=Corallococcus macrosporus DSM 14697 TaxID=1189310 RepID=A0A250JQA9_9BACT|nr:hypothetical protein [Corallococcus macrosporus]ATB45687.1 hypothetical protein MYMAC_001272 [Corallococcus macrosporus DSM 14697]